MNGKKAKAIRKAARSLGINDKTSQYYQIRKTGSVVADKGRQAYQRMKREA